MSQSDSFISEVTDEVRRDRMFALLRRYGWIGVVAVLAAVGGTGWVEWQKYRNHQGAEAFGDEMTTALEAEDPAAALQDLSGSKGQIAIARMAQAAVAADAGKTAEAVTALQSVASDSALPVSLRDLAALKAVIAAGDTMPADARKAALEPLAQVGRPFRLLAMEQQALALLAAGDKAGALTKAQDILMDANVSPDLRQRVNGLIVALGGTPPELQAMSAAQAAEN